MPGRLLRAVPFARVSRFVVGELLLAAMIVSVAAAARALRRELLAGVGGPPAWVADVVIALSAVIVLAETLGTLSLFRGIPLAAGGIAVGGVGWAVLRQRTARAPAENSALPRPHRVLYWIGLGGCTAVMAQWGAWAATPLNTGITDYDSLNYHLTFAARFVQTGSIAPLHYVVPDSPVHLYAQNAELLHAVALAVLRSDVASVCLNLGWLAFAILCGWAIGRRFGLGPLTGLAVAAIMAVPIMAATQAGTAENDAAALALFLASLAVFVNTTPAPGSRFVCGLAAGLAIGTKLTVIVPCLLLGAAILAAARGVRGRALGSWAGGAALTGSYWYVRNLVVTGSPDPLVHLGIGPVGFPYAHFRLIDLFGYSVAHYWNRPHVWRAMLIPGLAALGGAWPGLLAVVAAGAAYALVKRSGLARFLALVTIVSTAVYLVTPTTAIGFDGGPSLFAENLRYLTPALATGLILSCVICSRAAVSLAACSDRAARGHPGGDPAPRNVVAVAVRNKVSTGHS